MGKHEQPARIAPDGGFGRAYSVLEIKSLNDGERELEGVATTPTPDRLGDVVEPLGVEFKNPMPLLWQHKSAEPVGWVKFDKPTKDGINFTAKIAKITDPGKLKDRVDEAWQSVKAKLVRAVSIGFRAIELNFMDDGGIRFVRSEVLELSLVTIPANQDAQIDTIRSIDALQRAASGEVQRRVVTPGVTGSTSLPGVTGVKSTGTKMTKKVTIAEQISAFEATRAANAARMSEIMDKSAEEQRTLEQHEKEEYDTLAEKNKDIDDHLTRLRAHEEANKALARPVSEKAESSSALTPLDQRRPSVITVKANVERGIPWTRYCLAMMRAKGNRMEALDIARQEKSWHNTPEVELALSQDVISMMKAAAPSGTTLDATWASPLIAYQIITADFIEYLRPLTIIGRIPGLRRVPFNIQMPAATAGTSFGWVGEGAPKPVTKMDFATATLRWAKAAAIVVLTEELVRFSNPSAEAFVRSDLVKACAQFLDRDFVDPSKVEVLNVSPASVTNGVTPIVPSGTTAAAFRADVKRLFAQFFAANLATAGGCWIMTQGQALSLSLMQNTLGQEVFPGVTPEGGTLLGYPVVASENMPSTTGSPSEGFPIIFCIGPEVMLADDGQVVIDASREASLQMDTAPDSPPTAATPMVSLWQMNMFGLRAERWINWKKRRAQAVQFIAGAAYAE